MDQLLLVLPSEVVLHPVKVRAGRRYVLSLSEFPG
jgi:hypothetical protein